MVRGTGFFTISPKQVFSMGKFDTDLLKPEGFGQSLLDLRHTLLVLINVGGEDDEGQAF